MEDVANKNPEVAMFPKPSFGAAIDPRLQRAMSVAMETRKITPLLKEELRLTIMAKRMAAGQTDIDVTFPPAKSYDLTPVELEKRERRKSQNKMAARRHRRKSKSQTEDLVQEIEKQEKLRDQLEEEYKKLSSDKREVLTNLLAQHNGLAVSCDYCENEAGCQPMKTWLNVKGTINVDSSVFTIIQWEEAVQSEQDCSIMTDSR